MALDRLEHLQGLLRDLYEQLAGQEKAKVRAEDAQKVRIQQQIRDSWAEIRGYEREYIATLSQQVTRQDLPESIAEVVTGEIVDAVEILGPIEMRDEVKTLLDEILVELRKPGMPASAKLKVAIPIIPNVVSYELEGDTEGLVRRLFPTFVKVYEALTPKK
jgi:hypothetical protein